MLKRIKSMLSRNSYRGRRRLRVGSSAAAEVARGERLESRQLLTLGLNLDLTVVASDLHPSLRMHGGTDAADAPFQSIRYLGGTVTSLTGFDGGALLANPSDLTLEGGSLDSSNSIELLKLRDFDDGVSDGVADARYVFESDLPELSVKYRGVEFAQWAVSFGDLAISADGSTTAFFNLSTLRAVGVPAENQQPELLSFLSRSIVSGPSSGLRINIGALGDGTPWQGSADGEVFQATADLPSADSVSDVKAFAQQWDFSSPISYGGRSAGDDWFRVDLEAGQEYVARLSAASQAFQRLVVVAEDDQQLGVAEGTDPLRVSFTPEVSGPAYVVATPYFFGGTYTLSLTPADEVPLNADLQGNNLNWTTDFDSSGNAIAAEGYRVWVESAGERIYEADVAGSTQQHAIDAQFGLSDSRVYVGRVENGAVVATSDPVLVDGVRLRGNLNPLDANNTFTWDAIPGAARYELYLRKGRIVFIEDGTSFTLPETETLGWHIAYVRGVADDGERGFWSPAVNYFAKSVVQNTAVNSDVPHRPTITWDRLPSAHTFELLVNNIGTGEIGVVRETGLTSGSYDVNTDLPLGRYAVFVRPVTRIGLYGGWSVRETFSVGPVPSSITPGASNHRPVFTWATPPGVDSVELYIYSAGTVIRETGLTGNSWTPTENLSNGVVKWWVRGTTTGGETTAWSEPQTARIGRARIDGLPAVLDANRSYTLSWDPVVGAESYEVFRRDQDGAVVQDFVSSTETIVSPRAGRYKIWVNTIFADGSNAWSNSISFDVDTGNYRVLISAGTVASRTPTIEWLSTSSTRDTELWVTNLQDNSSTPDIRATGNSYTFSTALAPGRYKIWAREFNASAWSRSIIITVPEDAA